MWIQIYLIQQWHSSTKSNGMVLKLTNHQYTIHQAKPLNSHISIAVLSFWNPRFGSHVYTNLPISSRIISILTIPLKIKLLIHSYAVHLKIIRLIGLMINADHLEIKLKSTTYNRWKYKCYVNTNLR